MALWRAPVPIFAALFVLGSCGPGGSTIPKRDGGVGAGLGGAAGVGGEAGGATGVDAGCLALTFAIDDVPLGSNVWTLTAGDIDGDGNADVLANAGQVLGWTFLRGDGKGHLTAMGVVGNVESTGLPVLADIDGVQGVDIVVSAPIPATAGGAAGVDVMLNNGAGAFGGALQSLSTFTISALAVARIDGDEHPDLVFTDAGTETHLYVAPGNGDGTFGAATDLGALGGQAQLSEGPNVGLAVLDIDGDGRDDVVAATGEGATGRSGVGVWFNNGTTAMTKGPAIPFASSPLGLYVGDIDGDGHPDLADEDTQVFVLRGGGGTLTVVPSGVSGDDRSASVGVADVDHDGRDDVAFVTGIDVGFVEVDHATAQATFDAAFKFYVGHQPTFVVAADLDNDGVPDLVAATRDSDDVVILLSRPHPTGAADERSCSVCGSPSNDADSCQVLPAP